MTEAGGAATRGAPEIGGSVLWLAERGSACERAMAHTRNRCGGAA